MLQKVLGRKIFTSTKFRHAILQHEVATIHNVTIYDIVSHDSDNYVWDGTESQMVASTFTTIMHVIYLKYIYSYMHDPCRY